MKHKYTIQEIEDMRGLLLGLAGDETPASIIESVLQTYIMAGITLEDMKAEDG